MNRDTVTLRDYMEARLGAVDVRLAGLNEVREMALDAQRMFLTRQEAEVTHQEMMKKVEWLQGVVMPRNEFYAEHKALVEKVETKTGRSDTKELAGRIETLQTKLEGMQRFFWVGLGAATVLQMVLGAMLLWKHS